MEYTEFIIIVNVSSIIILSMMAILLCIAARFKGESSYATLIIALTTIPIYTYNVCHSMELYEVALYFSPIAFSINLASMPLLWMLAHRSFNPLFRFKPIQLWHFAPSLLLLVLLGVCVISQPAENRYDFMIQGNTGDNYWLDNINYIILIIQLVCYFYVIFRYLRKVKHYMLEYHSMAELYRKTWVPRFIVLFALIFIVEMICYVFCPIVNAWLPQLLTIIVMGYLLYSELSIAFLNRGQKDKPLYADVIAKLEVEFVENQVKLHSESDNSNYNLKQLQEYARQVEDYLSTSEAYINPNLSLKEVASAIGISSKNLSKAINAVLDKNFFDLVNGFRIEKSKVLLLTKKEKGLTLETIAEQCGFNSRVTFNNAFKKSIGMTTTNWVKLNSGNSDNSI